MPPALAGQELSGTQDPAASYQMDGHGFFAVSVRDLDATGAWYARALHLTVAREFRSPDGTVALAVLQRPGLTVELVAHRASIGVDSLANVSRGYLIQGLFKAGFFVHGIDELFNELRALGVQTDEQVIVDEEMSLRFFVFRDPEDNRLQAFERCDGECTKP